MKQTDNESGEKQTYRKGRMKEETHVIEKETDKKETHTYRQIQIIKQTGKKDDR